MKFYAKSFDELTNAELYEILKSRCEVFMLEQNIICQDMDDVDYRSLHCFFEDAGRVIAYLRAYVDETDDKAYHIGRVLTLHRGVGHGRTLMQKSMDLLFAQGVNKISLHAQMQAVGFYKKLGFTIVSEPFLEEGVEHVTMEYMKEA